MDGILRTTTGRVLLGKEYLQQKEFEPTGMYWNDLEGKLLCFIVCDDTETYITFQPISMLFFQVALRMCSKYIMLLGY